MLTIELTPEQIGFLRGLLEHVKSEHVPENPNIMQLSFGNGIDSILRALPE
jgi:hypothetical protein